MEQLKKILKYHSKTRYLSDKIYNKAIKCSKILTKKYRMSDQLLYNFFQKNKKIILIILIVLFIELSGYGILASLTSFKCFKSYIFSHLQLIPYR